MKLVVGLGNPGKEHAAQRHNIGFWAIDALAQKYAFPAFQEKFKGLFAQGIVGGEKVFLLKPLTYMNKSGESVAKVAQFYKIEPADIIILHDELDLAPGKIKIKTGGGEAGHNGLRSTSARLGTPDYKRVRIGIGHPGDKRLVHNYVLSNFLAEEGAFQQSVCTWLADVFDYVLKHDDAKALSEFALLRDQQQKV